MRFVGEAESDPTHFILAAPGAVLPRTPASWPGELEQAGLATALGGAAGQRLAWHRGTGQQCGPQNDVTRHA